MQSPNPPVYNQPPMSPPPRRSSIVGPVILIILGLAFLGQNIGLFDVSIWNVLWRLWPVWLIALGLDLMLGRRNAWGSWVVLGVVVTVVAGAVAFGNTIGFRTGGLGEPVAVSQPVGSAKRAQVQIDTSVSRLSITSGSSENLVEGTVTPFEWETLQKDARNNGDTLIFNLQSRGEQGRVFGLPINVNGSNSTPTWDLNLTDQIPMDIQIDTGVGESRIDLSKVQLTRLGLDTGVGESEISLPGQGKYRVDINSGVGELTIRLPRGIAARIHADQGIGSIEVDGDFTRESKSVYVSPNFSQAEHQAEIEIDGGVGEIVIEQY